MSPLKANSRAGRPGAATISNPITGRSGTGWKTTARSAAPSGSRRKHLNGMSNVHGGAFMAFADYWPVRDGRAGAAGTGRDGSRSVANFSTLRARANCRGHRRHHARRRLEIFMRGLLKSGERPLFTFSGTIKRVNRRTMRPQATLPNSSAPSSQRPASLRLFLPSSIAR